MEVKPARERILDAAAAVMREKGLANTTTKAIAAAAGYSEALLYKHFADKQELFLTVLKERVPQARLDSPGDGELIDNLTAIVEQLMGFFTQTFPIAASVFGAPELLAEHRKAMMGRGHGPAGPVHGVQSYLDAEQHAGRISAASDTASAARLLVGAAFHQGFLAAFDGFRTVGNAHAIAAGIVATILPALTETQ
ncbi:MAG: TetR/AcrR family transcriptional regulator [Nocardiopsaceae bacterium]|nr:TetR/AcrR family transcriptional regulator [Nocardiopsaceae bacterium]